MKTMRHFIVGRVMHQHIIIIITNFCKRFAYITYAFMRFKNYFLNLCRDIRGARPSPTGGRVKSGGAASEARYQLVFFSPGIQNPLLSNNSTESFTKVPSHPWSGSVESEFSR